MNYWVAYGGLKPALNLPGTDSYCTVVTVDVDEPYLFQYLSPDCKSIATKLRHNSKDDKELIGEESNRLCAEDIIENSLSPWKPQVVVVNYIRLESI